MVKLIVANILLLLIVSACKNEHKKYYDTGELMIEKHCIDAKDSLFTYKEYYKNGQVKAEGLLKKRHYHGYWTEYYPDGVVKWQGEYDFGRFLIMRDYDSTFFTKIEQATFYHENNIEFVLGKRTKFRTIIEDVHPELYCIYAIDTIGYLHSFDRDIEESYPYSIKVDSLYVNEDKGNKIIDMLFVFSLKNGVMDPEISPSIIIPARVYDDTMVVTELENSPGTP